MSRFQAFAVKINSVGKTIQWVLQFSFTAFLGTHCITVSIQRLLKRNIGPHGYQIAQQSVQFIYDSVTKQVLITALGPRAKLLVQFLTLVFPSTLAPFHHEVFVLRF